MKQKTIKLIKTRQRLNKGGPISNSYDFQKQNRGKKEILKEISEETYLELKDMSFHNEKDQLSVIKRFYDGES